MPKSKEAPHLRVRIEPRLLARLEKAREKSGRTLTGEIVSRLEQSFQREDQQKMMEEAAQMALTLFSRERGFPFVAFPQPGHGESQAESATPIDPGTKDKAP